jgi:xanthine dehydrogenase small subunit
VSLAAFEEFVRDLVPELAPILDRFGSPQIKNAGTLAGNIANASPIADTLPFLYVTDARLELTGVNGARVVGIREFYKGYKTLDLAPDEVITRILIPLPAEGETLRLYKVSKRSHLDISSFTAAMLMKRTDGRVDSMRIAYGGVGPVVLRLPQTEAFLAGKPLAAETFRQAGEIARGEVTPISDVRGSKEFRLQLAENILCKFFHEVTA